MKFKCVRCRHRLGEIAIGDPCPQCGNTEIAVDRGCDCTSGHCQQQDVTELGHVTEARRD